MQACQKKEINKKEDLQLCGGAERSGVDPRQCQIQAECETVITLAAIPAPPMGLPFWLRHSGSADQAAIPAPPFPAPPFRLRRSGRHSDSGERAAIRAPPIGPPFRLHHFRLRHSDSGDRAAIPALPKPGARTCRQRPTAPEGPLGTAPGEGGGGATSWGVDLHSSD